MATVDPFLPAEIGWETPPRGVTPTTVDLFRFSAVTWNPHRIHYDLAYARSEGHPDLLVQSHLHGNYLLAALLEAITPNAQVTHFAWTNLAPAHPGMTLVCSARLISRRVLDGPDRGESLEFELRELDASGRAVAKGAATVRLPATEYIVTDLPDPTHERDLVPTQEEQP